MESFEMFEIRGYFENRPRGLSDYAVTTNFDKAVDISHEFMGQCGYVEITDCLRGITVGSDEQEYWDGFEGESVLYRRYWRALLSEESEEEK